MATVDLLFSQSPVADLNTEFVFGEVDAAPPVDVPIQPVTTNLVFSESLTTGPVVSLVFGAEEHVDAAVTTLTIDGTLAQPELTCVILAGPVIALTVDGALDQPPLTAAFDLRIVSVADIYALLPDTPLVADFDAQYLTNTARPTVGQCANDWQIGSPTTQAGTAQGHQDSVPAPAGWAAFWAKTIGAGSTVVGGLPYDLQAAPVNQDTRFEQATPTRTGAGFKHQDGDRSRTGAGGRFQDATPRRSDTFFKHQDGDRTKRGALGTQWQVAARLTQSQWASFQVATDNPVGWHARHQDAMQPGVGVSVVIVVPPEPAYTPNAHLLFECPPLVYPHLVFGAQVCYPDLPVDTETIVIPVKRVYFMLNSAYLTRVDGGVLLPTFSMSLSLDVDSWTWGFSATLPGETLSSLEPSGAGEPVEVEAMINGVAYRALIEGISRTREFGKSNIQVQGRGRTALLDAPYAPSQSFTNSGARTAQQLMGDVLTDNGVPMGWVVDWGISDWSVPAGVFSHQGTYISALTAIANAAGGYIQPHASLQTIYVANRYPTTPWSWAAQTPDYELPADVTTRESIAWVEKARYNRVFVSGVQQGVLGQVTRTGTAGDLVAPMITDPLITEAAAARQRGMMVLGNTGRISNVNLRLPVLAETGVITPGKFVRYLDGLVSRTGIVRSVGVDVGLPEIWQTITVETHVN